MTLFNGSQVETGCRVNTSALLLTSVSSLTDCRDSDRRSATVTLPAEDGATTSVPAAAVTLDTATRAASCGKSFRASTAALLSARWPYISPSGQLPCKGPRVSVVDGGYADGAGTQGVIELWDQLEPLVAAYNAHPANATHPVVPTLVVVDNHYQSASAAARVPRTAEALVPLDAYRRDHGTRDTDRWQQAISVFATFHGLRQRSGLRRSRPAGSDNPPGVAGTVGVDALRGFPPGPDRSTRGPLRRSLGRGQQAAVASERTHRPELQLRRERPRPRLLTSVVMKTVFITV